MMPPATPPRARFAARFAIAALCLAALTGCQSLSTSSSMARVRIVDLSPDAGPLDIYQGKVALAYNLSYGTVTSYIPETAGVSTLTVSPAGSRQVLATAKATFAGGAQYTVVVNHAAARLQPEVLRDLPAQPLSEVPSVRFLHDAAQTGAVDVYLVRPGPHAASLSPIVENLVPGASSGYLALPPGVGSIVILPAGTAPSMAVFAAHTGTQRDYKAGSARTFILLDRQSPTGVRTGAQPFVIPMLDAEPAS